MNSTEIVSPCIGVCLLDASECCTGCGRSLAEIAAWPRADDRTKQAIVAAAARRLAMIGTGSDRREPGA